MTFPAITPLPAAPSRTQTPDQFATTADAFVAALPDLVTDVNTAGAYIDTKNATIGNTFKGNYSAGTTYALGDSVLYTDDKFYVSLQNANIGNTPGAAPSYWVEILGAVPQAPAGASITVTASGAISNGNLVSLNSNGTVSVTNGYGFDSETVFESASTSVFSRSAAFGGGKVVIAYADNGNSSFGTAVVGTVSGNSISFGTPVVFESASISNPSVTYDSTNGKFVIAYTDQGNLSYGTAVVGTVSGTSISFGTPVVFESANTSRIFSAFDSTNGKVVIAYQDNGNSQYPTAIVGTVSGTSISFGTAVVIESAGGQINGDVVFSSTSGKVVVFYSTGDSKGIVGTVSGTSISFGTPTQFSSSNASTLSAAYDSVNDKVVVAYTRANPQIASFVVGTVSGTSISFGSQTPLDMASDTIPYGALVTDNGSGTTFTNAKAVSISVTFDSSTGKVIITVGKDVSNTTYIPVICFLGTVSGTSIIFESPVVLSEATLTFSTLASVFDSTNNKVVVAYRRAGDVFGSARVFNSSSNMKAWVGIAAENISNAAEGTVTIVGGTNTGQTSLSVGKMYYISNTGTLTATPVKGRAIGRALSATSLLITQGNITQ